MTPFPLTELKKVEPLQGWEEFWQDGKAFHKTATAGYNNRPHIFTSEILYNLIAMAIEKFVMAALMHQGTMPYNHTMKDLVSAMDETFPDKLEEDMLEDLLKLDAFQNICDLEGFSISPPGMEKIPAMLELAVRLKTFVNKILKYDV